LRDDFIVANYKYHLAAKPRTKVMTMQDKKNGSYYRVTNVHQGTRYAISYHETEIAARNAAKKHTDPNVRVEQKMYVGSNDWVAMPHW
jgi:hypothetical protein